jgi:hypothetical protein
MPPAAEMASCAQGPLGPLPLPLVQRIFLLLPVDERARAACVHRSWRDALADFELWTRLQLPACSRAVCTRDGDALMRGACGRAPGRVVALDVSRLGVTKEALLAVLAENASTLRHLRVCVLGLPDERESANPTLAECLRAAPQLEVLDAETCGSCTLQQAMELLRLGPPLRIESLLLFDPVLIVDGAVRSIKPFAALLNDLALQPNLFSVRFDKVDTANPDEMGALVDAAMARQLKSLTFTLCTPPAAAPLARLLTKGTLEHLAWNRTAMIGEFGVVPAPPGRLPLLDAAGATLVADALRANTTLRTLQLMVSQLFCDVGAAAAVLRALAGHPTLYYLVLREGNDAVDDPAALGAALGAIVAANSPALAVLMLTSRLGDAGLAPIVDALPRNRHLEALDLRKTGMSENFARNRLLPAVRANTGLRSLVLFSSREEEDEEDERAGPAALEAVALVSSRQQRGE